MNEIRSDHLTPDNHTCSVAATGVDGPTVLPGSSGGHKTAPTHSDDAATAATAGVPYSQSPAVADLITKIKSAYKRRLDHMRSEIGLTLRIKASCRRFVTAPGKSPEAALKEADILYRAMLRLAGEGRDSNYNHPLEADALDWNRVLLAARAVIVPERRAIEKYLAAAVVHLPVYAWVESVRGFGPMSLACIVGEAGDIGSYRSVAGLWKRFGLGLIETTDEKTGEIMRSRQRLVAGNPELAIKHAYDPSRRSVMFIIGDVMVKMNRGAYRALYDARKKYEIERAPDIKPIIAHRRAQRYMEKRLLKHLRQAWRAARYQTDTTSKALPAYRSAAQDEPTPISHSPQSRRARPAAPIPSGTDQRPSIEYDTSRTQATIHERATRDNQASPASIPKAKRTDSAKSRATTLEGPITVNHPSRAPIPGTDSSTTTTKPSCRQRTATRCSPLQDLTPSALSSGACIAAKPDTRARQPRPAVVNAKTNASTPAAPVHATAKVTTTPNPGTRGGARAAKPPASSLNPNGRNGVRINGAPPLEDFGDAEPITELAEQDA